MVVIIRICKLPCNMTNTCSGEPKRVLKIQVGGGGISGASEQPFIPSNSKPPSPPPSLSYAAVIPIRNATKKWEDLSVVVVVGRRRKVGDFNFEKKVSNSDSARLPAGTGKVCLSLSFTPISKNIVFFCTVGLFDSCFFDDWGNKSCSVKWSLKSVTAAKRQEA